MPIKCETQCTTLPSGLRIVTVEMPWASSFCAGLWNAMGSRHEPARINGVCHFLEHMVFKGTRRRSAMRIVREIEEHGGYINAFTAEDHTCYYVKAMASRLENVADILTDLYYQPKLLSKDIEREREVIAEEIRGYQDNASIRVEDMLDAALWPGHALGRPVTGTLATLGRIGQEDLVAQHALGTAPHHTIVAVAGRISHDQVLHAFLKHVPHTSSQRRLPRDVPCLKRTPKQFAEAMDVEQCHVELGFRTCGRKHRDRHALKLLSILLAENMSSRLFQRLREAKGLCYHIQSEVHLLSDCGSLVIHLSLDSENLSKAMDIIMQEIWSVSNRDCSARELSGACGYAIGQLVMSAEKTSGRMFYAAESLLAYGEVLDVSQTVAAYQAVSATEIRRVAANVLRPDRMAVAIVCPSHDLAKVERVLAQSFSTECNTAPD